MLLRQDLLCFLFPCVKEPKRPFLGSVPCIRLSDFLFSRDFYWDVPSDENCSLSFIQCYLLFVNQDSLLLLSKVGPDDFTWNIRDGSALKIHRPWWLAT